MAMMHSSRRTLAAVLAATLLLPLVAACGDADEQAGGPGASTQADGTLAERLAGSPDLSTVSGVVGDAGLADVFGGAAAYTILAPRDAAFDALGTAGADLRKPENRAAAVALLRAHIVPGYLTPKDIATALAADRDGKVQMRTMAGSVVTFSKSGADIVATADDGATGVIATDAVTARNGVAIPVNGVLRKLEQPAA